MSKRSLAVMVGVLAALCLSGCGDKSGTSSAGETAPDPTSAGPTRSTFVPAEYCKLYKLSEDQLDGDPFDARMYAAATQSMRQAAESGSPELADEWAILIEAFQTIESAAVKADLAELSEITRFEVIRARAGEGTWPRGVDRGALEEFDRAVAKIPDGPVGRADDAISRASRQTCDTDE